MLVTEEDQNVKSSLLAENLIPNPPGFKRIEVTRKQKVEFQKSKRRR